MKTVGDVLDKIEDACAMIDKLHNCNDIYVGPVEREDLLVILRDYCVVLRHIPVKQ